MFAKVSDKEFRVVEKTDNLYNKLPRGTYALGFDAMTGQYFLTLLPTKPLPGRIYGDIIAKSERIMTTYVDRVASTGVMLDGEKGSGKTLLARCISALAHDRHDMPTVLVADKVSGGAFNRLLAAITQPIVLVFEEFEKMYGNFDGGADKAQAELLSLFDGMFTPESKRLIIFTCNASARLNAGLLNRPSRIFYHMRFRGMSDDAVREYCKENLANSAHVEGVTAIVSAFPNFNFDMLQCLVEEMNRYKEEAHQAVKDMSIQLSPTDPKALYEIVALRLAEEATDVDLDSRLYSTKQVQALATNWSIPICSLPKGAGDRKEKTKAEPHYINVCFAQSDLKKVSPRNGTMIFVNDKGDRATVERIATLSGISLLEIISKMASESSKVRS